MIRMTEKQSEQIIKEIDKALKRHWRRIRKQRKKTHTRKMYEKKVK